MQCRQCRQCGQAAAFTPTRREERRRAGQFLVFGAALAAAGGLAAGLGAVAWGWVLLGMAAFVGSQALLKWTHSRWVLCPHCGAGYTAWGPGD